MKMIRFSPLDFRPVSNTMWWREVRSAAFHNLSDAVWYHLCHTLRMEGNP